MTNQTEIMLLYVRVGLAVLTARLVLVLTLVLTFALFAWAMWDPTYPRIGCATLFAVLAYLPATRIDAKMAPDRAVVQPKEQ
jgi:hypothetical protein